MFIQILPKLKEIADTYVDQDHYPASSAALYSSSGYKHCDTLGSST